MRRRRITGVSPGFSTSAAARTVTHAQHLVATVVQWWDCDYNDINFWKSAYIGDDQTRYHLDNLETCLQVVIPYIDVEKYWNHEERVESSNRVDHNGEWPFPFVDLLRVVSANKSVWNIIQHIQTHRQCCRIRNPVVRQALHMLKFATGGSPKDPVIYRDSA
jgi:hypothetical protein